MHRLEKITNTLQPPPHTQDNQVVICAAVRTPLQRAKKGYFKNTPPEILLATVLQQVCKRSKINKTQIQDIVVGNVLQPGAGSLTSRMAQYLAGFPDSTTTLAVNRQCSSGLEACAIVASKIKSGFIEVGIGSGVESMSMYDMQSTLNQELLSEKIFEHEKARNCLITMGMTSENVVQKFGLSRNLLDEFSAESHRKASQAQKNGLFKSQIVPVKTQYLNKDNKKVEVEVTEDDGIRPQTTIEALSKLKPSFKKDGSTTAGNSSQVTDGAAAVLLTKRSYAIKHNLPIIAKFVDYVVVGVPPQIMGIGPSVAIPDLLKKNGLRTDNIKAYEINEAFASQSFYCIQKCGIDPRRVNQRGGAIALGHPLGCTGARLIASLLPQLQRGNLGVVSMCIGTGMGAAALIEKE